MKRDKIRFYNTKIRRGPHFKRLPLFLFSIVRRLTYILRRMSWAIFVSPTHFTLIGSHLFSNFKKDFMVIS